MAVRPESVKLNAPFMTCSSQLNAQASNRVNKMPHCKGLQTLMREGHHNSGVGWLELGRYCPQNDALMRTVASTRRRFDMVVEMQESSSSSSIRFQFPIDVIHTPDSSADWLYDRFPPVLGKHCSISIPPPRIICSLGKLKII